MSAPSFMKYLRQIQLRTKVNFATGTLSVSSNPVEIPEAMKKIITDYCNNQEKDDMVELCLVFATYDYHTASSAEWEPSEKRHEFIFKWATRALKTIAKGGKNSNFVKKEVAKMTKDYHKGLIPDGLNLIDHYYC